MGRKIINTCLILAAIQTMLVVPWLAHATEYYVNQNHTSASDQNPGTPGLPWKSIAKANLIAMPGDTVYIIAGVYNSQIAPTRSGTSGNPITYQAADGSVTISGQEYGMNFTNKEYIRVIGPISVTLSTKQPLLIANGHYNLIHNCSFIGGTGDYWGSEIIDNSTYNWIDGCTFALRGSLDKGGVFAVGTEASTIDTTQYNLIENCHMYAGAHHVIAILGRYNIIRNNFFHNEAWNPYGHRVLYVMGSNSPYFGIRNVIEGNRIGYAGISYDGGVNHGQLNAGNYNITRYNTFLSNTGAGIGLNCGSAYPVAPSYNAVYNNTFYGNSSGGDRDGGGVDFNDWGHPGSITGNIFKNNLFYENGSPVRSFRNYGGVTLTNQTFAYNFNGTNSENVNPSFKSTAGKDPFNKGDAPDLSLQSGSPAIDYGGPLTTVAAADTGTGITLILTDAAYFQDGTWAPPGAVQADWIAVGAVTNVVQIAAINYSANTITIASSINRKDGDQVWLYKKSDGVRVLYGPAPDAGAHEFIPYAAPQEPRNLRILE